MEGEARLRSRHNWGENHAIPKYHHLVQVLLQKQEEKISYNCILKLQKNLFTQIFHCYDYLLWHSFLVKVHVVFCM